jgi:hypothetical protein
MDVKIKDRNEKVEFLKKNIIIDAASKHACGVDSPYDEYAEEDFITGTEFAEKELKEITIQFGEWLLVNTGKDYINTALTYIYHGQVKSPEELLHIFLNEKNR